MEHPERALASVFVTPDLEPSGYVRDLERDLGEDAFFNFPYMRRDWRGFAAKWAQVAFPHAHSTRQREDAESHLLETDPETYIASMRGLDIPDRQTTDAMAAKIRCPPSS